MAIVDWPDDIAPPTTLTCALCNKHMSSAQASAGMQIAGGQQAFACDRHFKERQLLVGWTEYAFSQVPGSDLDDGLWLEEFDEQLLH